MIVIALLFLVLGVVCALFVFSPELNAAAGNLSEIALALLILSVGIDIGFNKEIFKKIKEYHFKILLIPLVVALASILSGVFTGLCFGMKPNEGGAIGAGFGWYSLSAILLNDLSGSRLAVIAFLSNIFREVLTIMTVPLIAKYLNVHTTIAPAGATSMDTTLPIITKYTNSEVAVISVVNGVILSALVPVPLLYNFL